MKLTLTTILILLLTNAHAQRVKYSPREPRNTDVADFEIIGHINGNNLICIEGSHGAEIGVYDDEMKKIKSVPVNFSRTKAIQKNFFAYPDHYLLFVQYVVDDKYYLGRLTGDGEGNVGNMTVMDSMEFSVTVIPNSNSTFKPEINFPPMFLVLRSENKQWFMILKNGASGNNDQKIDATLFDKEFNRVEHTRFTYPEDMGSGEFSEFILDNDGDLAFVFSNHEEEGRAHRIISAELYLKPHGADSLVSRDLSVPGVTLDDLNIRVDNLNHRYILTSLYYKGSNTNLTGLCSMLWDERSRSMTSTTLTPLSTEKLAEARSDFTPPEQVLNNYYLRQVFPLADGGFMVLAELCYGREKFVNAPREVWRFDFIRRNPSFFSPLFPTINATNQGQSGHWQSTGTDRFGNHGAFGIGRNTDNLLLFIMNPEGKAHNIKVIHKSEYTTPGMETLSFQSFNDGKAIRLMYNENIKGHWLPVGSSINIDGSIGQDPVLPGLGRDQILFPRYGKQVGPQTAIIPGQEKGHLFFARVNFE